MEKKERLRKVNPAYNAAVRSEYNKREEKKKGGNPF